VHANYYIYHLLIAFWCKKVQEQRDVKWLLIVSLALLYISWIFSFSYYPLRAGYSALEAIVLNISHAAPLSFVATLTAITLYTTDFGNKDLTFKVSMYLFITSMALFALSILRYMFLSRY